jgi:hypothetical protein
MLGGVVCGRSQNCSLRYRLFYSKIPSLARDPYSA